MIDDINSKLFELTKEQQEAAGNLGFLLVQCPWVYNLSDSFSADKARRFPHVIDNYRSLRASVPDHISNDQLAKLVGQYMSREDFVW